MTRIAGFTRRQNRRTLTLICAMLLIAMWSPAAPPQGVTAQETAAKTENPDPQPGNAERFVEFAKDYQIHDRDEHGPLLALHLPAILTWNNPARTGEQGAVFVWELDGRPLTIGSTFTYRVQNTVYHKHEFQSLSDGPLLARFRGAVAWTPQSAGLEWKPLDKAPQPAGSERQRLLQMRLLARDFSGTLIDGRGNKSELRLVPQPLYRYTPQKAAAFDGAIFSLALGTDPEALVIIEAVKDSATKSSWRYAAARFHYAEVLVQHRGNQVFHVEIDRTQESHPMGKIENLKKTYSSFSPPIPKVDVTIAK